MFLLIFCLLIVALIFWHQKKFSRRNFLLSKIPSPEKYLILDHIPILASKNPQTFFAYLEESHKKLGDVYYFSFANVLEPMNIVADVKICEQLLSDNDEINKSKEYENIEPWIGTGLLVASNKKWFQRRKLLTPGFHFQILEKFIEVMDESSNILAKKLEKVEGEVDVFPVANFYSLDTVCECTMAKKLYSQLKDSQYARDVKEITANMTYRAFNVIEGNEFLYKFTKRYRREKELIKDLHAFTNGIIESRREELLKLGSENLTELAESKKKALIDILLTSTIDGVPLTNEDIREEVDTFLFAGHDTTTSALSFIFYNIAKYPEVQQRIYEEISTNFDENLKLTLKKLNSLPYIELVIKESLRLFPSVPYYARKLKKEFSAAGITFPAQTGIYVSPYLMGRNEKYFDDPLEFKPERFDVETTYEKINPFAYVPFSAGPRNCIGQRFALLSLKSAIVKVVKNFKLSLGEKCDDPPVLALEIVLRPVNGIFLKFEKRST